MTSCFASPQPTTGLRSRGPVLGTAFSDAPHFLADPEQLVKPVERRCDFESCLETVNRLLHLALGVIDPAKNSVTSTNQKFIAWDAASSAAPSWIVVMVVGVSLTLGKPE